MEHVSKIVGTAAAWGGVSVIAWASQNTLVGLAALIAGVLATGAIWKYKFSTHV